MPERPTSALAIERVDHDVFRGFPLHLQGSVRAAGRGCHGLRVDVQLLVGPDKTPRTVGSLSTDADGRIDGAVVLPRDLPLGDHELTVVTSGDETCGPGQGY
jgi:5-hydroxyisourate hydrolase-like protein (transthyretin family)